MSEAVTYYNNSNMVYNIYNIILCIDLGHARRYVMYIINDRREATATAGSRRRRTVRQIRKISSRTHRWRQPVYNNIIPPSSSASDVIVIIFKTSPSV